jgi:hypothetical protein
MSLLLLTLDIPTTSYEISTHNIVSRLYFTSIAPSSLAPCDINITGTVLSLIETSSDPLSTNISVLSDDTYVEEERTLELDDPEARLN